MTPKQQKALDALDIAPTKNQAKVLALWRALVEAFDGAPPARSAYMTNMLFLDGPRPELLDTERAAWCARNGKPMRDLPGPLGQ